ncbi:MAG: hypothetical protein GX466_08620 [Candidatus Cloacimonetes bacterium]|nr:hypothetical protein [Candidatus Cloacimonadota bacterium]
MNDPKGWKSELSGFNHAFAHTWENNNAMHLSTGLPTYLYCFTKDTTKIICPISERRYKQYTDIFTPYGLSGFAGTGPCPEFNAHWHAFIDRKEYVTGFFTLNPLIDQYDYFPREDIYSYNDLYILGLSQSKEQLFSNLSTNRKRQLQHFESIKEEICLDKPALIEFFLTNYREFYEIRNASSLYQLSEESLLFLFNQNNLFMVGIMKEKSVIAVSVFGYTEYMADFLFNISLPKGKSYSVALLWFALLELKSTGIPYLNLGGGVKKNDSLADFKRRFGADVYPLCALKQIYNKEAYIKLCVDVNADPDNRIGYFPPYQKP